MNLALVLGEQGKVIAQRLTAIKDNLNISIYNDIPSCIDMSIKRAMSYDRILLVGNNVSEPLLHDLYEYWSAYNKEASIVIICKSSTEQEIAKQFLGVFQTPLSAVMLVESATVKLISEAVLRSPSEIMSEYGIKDYLNVEIERDVVAVPEPPKPAPVTPARTEPPKKKKSLFSALFGRKEKTEKVEVKQTEPASQTAISEPASVQQYEQPVSQPEQVQIQQPVPQFTAPVQQVEETVQQPVFENQNIIPEEPISTQEISFDPVTEQVHNVYDDVATNNSPLEVNKPAQRSVTEEPSTPLFNDTNSSPAQGNTPTEPVFAIPAHTQTVQVQPIPVPRRSQNGSGVDIVEESFEPLGVFDSSQHTTNVELQVATVTETFDDLNVGASESNYVTNTIQPAPVDNTKVSGKLTALADIYAGRSRKIVVVTGDRGSGVTTTAYSLAMSLSKKIDVLYVDCDVENHGLLSYIDYDNFRNYDEQHMSGVKLCKSYQLFDSCIVNWAKNMYFLTSDYSCDTTKEELSRSMEVVAERAGDLGVVIIDCPIKYLDCISDLILAGKVVVCTESSKRGFMNMLCQLEGSELANKVKRTLAYKGIMFLTKLVKGSDINKLVSAVKTVYEPDEVDWLAIPMQAFNGVYDDKLLNEVLK